MPTKPTQKVTWRIDPDALSQIEKIAQEDNTTTTAVVNAALKYYADRYYLENKATMLPTEILNAMRSTVDLMEHRINNKSNQLLSSMAIQLYIIDRVIADNLGLTPDTLEAYRVEAVEYLRTNNRLLHLTEMLPLNEVL